MHAIATLAAIGLVTGLAYAPAPAQAEPFTEEAELVLRTNVLRLRLGLAPLIVDTQLADVARSWSASMAAQNAVGHNPNLESQARDWSRLGENVAVGKSVTAMQAEFESTAGQYHNLTDPDFQSIGVGVVDAGGQIWVTVDLKIPENGPAIPRLPVPALSPLAPDAPEEEPGGPAQVPRPSFSPVTAAPSTTAAPARVEAVAANAAGVDVARAAKNATARRPSPRNPAAATEVWASQRRAVQAATAVFVLLSLTWLVALRRPNGPSSHRLRNGEPGQ